VVSLEDQLECQRRKAWDSRTPEERSVRAEAIKAVHESGVAQNALRVGEQLPLFKLPDATGREVNIGDLLSDGPVVLSFYRGSWCPYCNLELRVLQTKLRALHQLGASLVAISPELPDRSLSNQEKHNLRFPVLTDSENVVARQFRLVHPIAREVAEYQLANGNDVARYNGSAVAEVPLPATYVADRSGTVVYSFVAADYTQRSDPEGVMDAVRKIVANNTA
jgi:peroxiredoxin